jgi:hypothetical protein
MGVILIADNILAQKGVNKRKGRQRDLQIYTSFSGTAAKNLKKNVAGELALVFHTVKQKIYRSMDCLSLLISYQRIFSITQLRCPVAEQMQRQL